MTENSALKVQIKELEKKINVNQRKAERGI